MGILEHNVQHVNPPPLPCHFHKGKKLSKKEEEHPIRGVSWKNNKSMQICPCCYGKINCEIYQYYL
jgi:hypothetical protein